MSKELVFTLGGETFAAQPVKLERGKLYGTKITFAIAENDICTAVSLDSSGTLVIPVSGIKNGLLNDDGEWIERSELIAVDDAGNVLPVLPSSFEQEIALERTVTAEEFLDHQWKSVYELGLPELAQKIGTKIYSFPFNYRGGVELNDGFLLASGTCVWLFSGIPLSFSYLEIAEEGCFDENDEAETQMDDELDFDMMK